MSRGDENFTFNDAGSIYGFFTKNDNTSIISIKIKGVSQITNDFAVLFYEMEYTGFEPVAFTMRM